MCITWTYNSLFILHDVMFNVWDTGRRQYTLCMWLFISNEKRHLMRFKIVIITKMVMVMVEEVINYYFHIAVNAGSYTLNKKRTF